MFKCSIMLHASCTCYPNVSGKSQQFAMPHQDSPSGTEPLHHLLRLDFLAKKGVLLLKSREFTPGVSPSLYRIYIDGCWFHSQKSWKELENSNRQREIKGGGCLFQCLKRNTTREILEKILIAQRYTCDEPQGTVSLLHTKKKPSFCGACHL